MCVIFDNNPPRPAPLLYNVAMIPAVPANPGKPTHATLVQHASLIFTDTVSERPCYFNDREKLIKGKITKILTLKKNVFAGRFY